MVSSPRKQIENVKVEPGISGTHSIISVSIISIINDLTTQKTDQKCIRRTWDLWDPLNNLCIHTWKTDEEYKRCTYLGSLGRALRSTPWTWSASSSCESSLVVHLILQMWSGWSLRATIVIQNSYFLVGLFGGLIGLVVLVGMSWLVGWLWTWAGTLPASLSSSSARRLSNPESSAQPDGWNI